jgi:hypothetical protein
MSIIAVWGCLWGVTLSGIWLASQSRGWKAVLDCWLCFLTFISVGTGLLVLPLPAVLVLCVMAGWPVKKTHPAVPTLACALIVAGFGAMGLLAGLDRLDELRQLRQEYAFRSVAPRLAYEARAAADRTADGGVSAEALAPDVAARLTAFERRGSSSNRGRMLQFLHDETRAEFEMLTGFGPIRMRSLNRRELELPPSDPVPQPATDGDFDERDPFWTMFETSGAPPVPGQDALLSLHDRSFENFLDPERMGYVVDRDRVAGFESHRFSRLPAMEPHRAAGGLWKVERLELIGLLSHDRPLVYVSEQLPNLEELGDAALRELDDFERGALEQLRAARDVVSAEYASHIRLVGALRAGQSCLECHQVERGDLLGAFSYVIRPQTVGEADAATIAAAH